MITHRFILNYFVVKPSIKQRASAMTCVCAVTAHMGTLFFMPKNVSIVINCDYNNISHSTFEAATLILIAHFMLSIYICSIIWVKLDHYLIRDTRILHILCLMTETKEEVGCYRMTTHGRRMTLPIPTEGQPQPSFYYCNHDNEATLTLTKYLSYPKP